MLTIKRIKGSEGESNILLDGKVVGIVQDCKHGFDVCIISKNNPFAFRHCGSPDTMQEVYNVFIVEAKDIFKTCRQVTTELNNLGDDLSRAKHYVSMKMLNKAIENRQEIIDNLVEFCYDEFELLIKEDDE